MQSIEEHLFLHVLSSLVAKNSIVEGSKPIANQIVVTDVHWNFCRLERCEERSKSRLLLMMAFYLVIHSVLFSQKDRKSTHQNLGELTHKTLTLRQKTCLFVVDRETTLRATVYKKKAKVILNAGQDAAFKSLQTKNNSTRFWWKRNCGAMAIMKIPSQMSFPEILPTWLYSQYMHTRLFPDCSCSLGLCFPLTLRSLVAEIFKS